MCQELFQVLGIQQLKKNIPEIPALMGRTCASHVTLKLTSF